MNQDHRDNRTRQMCKNISILHIGQDQAAHGRTTGGLLMRI